MGDVKRVGEILVEAAEKAGQYAVDVGDGELVRIWSLPPGSFENTADRTGWSFFMIAAQPLQREDVAFDVVKAAYKKAGKPLPDLSAIANVYRLVVEIPGDLPETITVEGGAENPTSAS